MARKKRETAEGSEHIDGDSGVSDNYSSNTAEYVVLSAIRESGKRYAIGDIYDGKSVESLLKIGAIEIVAGKAE